MKLIFIASPVLAILLAILFYLRPPWTAFRVLSVLVIALLTIAVFPEVFSNCQRQFEQLTCASGAVQALAGLAFRLEYIVPLVLPLAIPCAASVLADLVRLPLRLVQRLRPK